MFFLGTLFCSGKYSLDTTPLKTGGETSVTVGGCVADELFVTGEVMTYNPNDTSIPGTWDYYTIMHALFNGTLLAGNIDFYVDNVDFFRIKRRKRGDLKWVTLHEFEAISSDDLNIDYIDKTPRSHEHYSYSITPVINGSEAGLYSNDIYTDFEGLAICDAETVYSTDLNVRIAQTRNKVTSVVPTLNRKYPYVISNGMSNYDSGSVAALFAKYNATEDDWDFDGAHEFRDSLKAFLYNGSPKILKHADGRMWLMLVSSSQISEIENGHAYNIQTSFEFAEIGDCDSEDDLRANGLIGNKVV